MGTGSAAPTAVTMEAAIHRENGFISAEPVRTEAPAATSMDGGITSEALAAASEALAGLMRGLIRPPPVDPGRLVIGYAALPSGAPFHGLADDLRRRVDGLPPHERESLARTGRHYCGLKALAEHEQRAERLACECVSEEDITRPRMW